MPALQDHQPIRRSWRRPVELPELRPDLRAAPVLGLRRGQPRQMTVAGGEVAGYTRLLTDSRNQAQERMRLRGASAVVAMRFDCNEIGEIMSRGSRLRHRCHR